VTVEQFAGRVRPRQPRGQLRAKTGCSDSPVLHS
jgi:hypothetical protein